MNLEWKTKWIEALRSDKYLQCRNSFKMSPNYFCPIGLLLHLVQVNNSDIFCIFFKQLELPLKDVSIIITLNDVSNKSFNEIADWIEINL